MGKGNKEADNRDDILSCSFLKMKEHDIFSQTMSCGKNFMFFLVIL